LVEAHRDKTQEEMAKLWSEPISARSISRALKKIGFTRKKRPMAIGSSTESTGIKQISSKIEEKNE
jgi:hypothetical protein